MTTWKVKNPNAPVKWLSSVGDTYAHSSSSATVSRQIFIASTFTTQDFWNRLRHPCTDKIQVSIWYQKSENLGGE